MPARVVMPAGTGAARSAPEASGEGKKVIEIRLDGDDPKVDFPERDSSDPGSARDKTGARTSGSGKA
ncbi:MAG TPA: hypothetical protein PK264_01505, partial [Hyphomicrobiaceae bacterium]|nr:hypothetical protein [Hyphomicrobiaceae bacterium]